MPDNPSLDGAYALNSPEDAKRLYADWAETYDTGFIAEMEFVMPHHVAVAFAQSGGKGPVLDFGAGTGIVGEHLHRLEVGPADALDLSPEMLAVAARKGVYRDLIEGNLMDGLELPHLYQGIVSCGTFTHGHVGPDALQYLLDVAMPGARFALSINKEHFEAAGFAEAFDALDGQITDLRLPEARYYGDKATGPHKDDIGYIALFKKA